MVRSLCRKVSGTIHPSRKAQYTIGTRLPTTNNVVKIGGSAVGRRSAVESAATLIRASMARHIWRVLRLRRKSTSGRNECRTTTAKNVSIKARTIAEMAVARSPERDVRGFT